MDPGRNHLAIPTEDHPLEYAGFEGEIPEGEYGAGSVSLWDEGDFECEKCSEREVVVVLHGRRVTGRYALFQTGTRRWMIHRMDPPPRDWQPLPDHLSPMLAQPGPLPSSDEGWAYELKWDGVRALAYVERGRVHFRSRNDLNITATYPELHGIGLALGSRQALLDGEIVAWDDAGRPSFTRLQRRMHVAELARARRLTASVPVTYVVFDVLHLDGRPLLDVPYDRRRELLVSLRLEGAHWSTPQAFTDRVGTDVLRAALGRGLEGVVCKRRDSPYQPGRRSQLWVKVKGRRTQEVVIGGFTPGKGHRQGRLGALVVGIPKGDGLAYVGKVGTGFSDEALEALARRLAEIRRTQCPFTTVPPVPQVLWVEPMLVGEVEFAQWTRDGRLRQPSWRGLRPDKSPAEVVRES